ncbi:amylo-alpha-1,6-glucosidase [Armatimonas rosea]|uniref:Putative glycogen debranching enzyme n=1 Tax=Armatimonas rosea TaxID=685828 RepID=A0A7W9SW06_ARMRO|nr:amylo-alpha-1,6-glucosidase [Armatimonas rosea]MBB6053423.1 putative glycogen debranching enzyme [Armatimonas rosea]
MTFEELASKEWLLTNGIGGFASGTLAGCATRRYHSLLTIALDPPSGRRMSLLGGLDETVIIDGVEYPLSTHIYADGTIFPNGWKSIQSFGEYSFFTIQYEHATKNFCMEPGKNTIYFEYGLPNEDPFVDVKLRLAPLVCWKEIHSQMRPWDGFPFRSEPTEEGWLFQATEDAPVLRLIGKGEWQRAGWWNEKLAQPRERDRGFDWMESLYCPAILTSSETHPKLTVTTELSPITSLEQAELEVVEHIWEGIGEDTRGRHVWPIRHFLLGGNDCRTTILAGYPWFTDWGRDTFISLPGLCLTTGREEIARQIIRDFVPWVRNGRIPNRFPDNLDEPAYNNVDGTLWFLHCIGLCGLTEELSEVVQQIIAAHLEGTVGDGIFCDSDGLLRCGDDHTNLTWMDAKVDGVAITPRYDRPVEVQALWINALRVAGRVELAERATATFLARFVRADGLGLYDCLLPDGTPDASIRPNQVIAAALLDLPASVNQAILAVATEHLLTPFGLRTLSPADSRFCPRYEGGPHQRDAAYHQGTVWPWLIGSFCELYKKVHGADADLSVFLSALERHLTEDYGLGGIAEVFDGAAPHRPNGCPWQAWSLAEVLRSKAAHADGIAAPIAGDL